MDTGVSGGGNEFIDSQRAATSDGNTNVPTCITGVPTKVDEVTEVVKDEDINI